MVAKWQVEIKDAQQFRLQGNEGRARVCARRAAGAVTRDFLIRRGEARLSLNAYDALRLLAQHPGLDPELRAAAGHLILRVDELFRLPQGVDLLAEARLLCEHLARE
jgi:hypothetical protein